MYWDNLCGIVERNKLGLGDFLNDAKLFIYKGPECKKTYLFSDKDKAEEFQLPFPTIAVEDNIGIVVLHDESDNQIGLHKKRKCMCFLELCPVCSILGCMSFRKGMISQKILNILISFDLFFVFQNGKLLPMLIDYQKDQGIQMIKRVMQEGIGSCIANVFKLVDPKNTIIKINPSKKISDKSKKIFRADDRPLFFLIDGEKPEVASKAP